MVKNTHQPKKSGSNSSLYTLFGKFIHKHPQKMRATPSIMIKISALLDLGNDRCTI